LDESTRRYDHEHQAGPSAVRQEDKTRSSETPFASSGSTWRARIVNDRHTGYFPPEACTTCASLQPPVECYSLQDEGLICQPCSGRNLETCSLKVLAAQEISSNISAVIASTEYAKLTAKLTFEWIENLAHDLDMDGSHLRILQGALSRGKADLASQLDRNVAMLLVTATRASKMMGNLAKAGE
jgi:hypothetical protein